MEKQECPECGALSIEDIESDYDGLGLSISEPYCPNGHGTLTNEGLLNKKIVTCDGSTVPAEVGKADFVISQGANDSEQLTSLLQTIRSLEEPLGSAKVADLMK